MSGTVMQIVRVAILADSRLTEMALPAELPLREILPAVQCLVVPSAQNGDGGQADSGAAVQLSLAPVGGQPFSLDASLTPSVSSTVICWCCSRCPPVRPRRASSKTSPTPR